MGIVSMLGQAVELARHQHGCRVILRLIERCDENDQLAQLLDELEVETESLACHPFGNFVIQHVLRYSSADRGARIAQRLLPRVSKLAGHPTASRVVQHALDHANEMTKRDLVGALLGAESPHSIEDLATSKYGSFVVEQLWTQCPNPEYLCWRLAHAIEYLNSSEYGRLLAEKLKLSSSIVRNLHFAPFS